MKIKFCPECGFKFDREYRFCPECGFKISSIGGENSENNGVDNSLDFGISSNEFLDTGAKISDQGFDFSSLENAFDSQIEENESIADKYEQELKRAKIYCVRGKYLEAKAIYERILKDDVGNIDANFGILRTLSKNLTEYDEQEIQAQLDFLFKLFGEDKLKKEQPEIVNFFKVKEQYFIDKEKLRQKKIREEEYQKARENFLNLTYAKSRAFNEIQLGAYPQSLMKDGVKILFPEPDPENGFLVGSDYNYYKEFNGKYFKVEPVVWSKLYSDAFLFYSVSVLNYCKFGNAGCSYEDSNLKEVLHQFLKEFNPKKLYLDNVRYSSPYPSKSDDKVIDYSSGSYIFSGNGCTYQKDKSQIFSDCIFPLQVPDVEIEVLLSPWGRAPKFTDYALEQYRVQTNTNFNEPSNKYWTRTLAPGGYVFVGDFNKRAFKHDRLSAREAFTQPRGVIAGVRPVISVSYNQFLNEKGVRKNGF